MGVVLRIGEARMRVPPPERVREIHELAVTITAEEKELVFSPGLDPEPNHLRFSYGNLGEALGPAGLLELLPLSAIWTKKRHDKHLVPSSPGAALLLPLHLEAVRKGKLTYAAFYKLSPNEPDDGLDVLRWIERWMEWALQHCKVPVFVNELA